MVTGRPDGGDGDEGGGADDGGGDEGGGDEGGGDEGGGDEGDDGEEGAGDERDGAGAGGRPVRARRAPGEWWNASALSTRCADLVAGTGAVDALDVSDLAGADEGDAILLQLPGGHYTLAVR